MADSDDRIARIARIWRGYTVPEKADAYAEYLLEVVLDRATSRG